MQPNPVLRKLGFSDSDRLVVIHVDDVGAYEAGVSAYSELVDFGLISSAAAMTPCGWFPAAAAYCRQHPQVDMGVHLTLNSEYDTCRWGPVSTRDRSTGLLDDAGYLHQWQPAVYASADPAAVAREIEAQVEQAVTAGIDITHMDSHMGTVLHPRFVRAYAELALRCRVPPAVIFRGDEETYRVRFGADAEQAAVGAALTRELEAQGVPLLDHFAGMPLDKPEGRLEEAKRLLGQLQPGITHFAIHPAKDTPEIRAMSPDWQNRVGDYEVFRSAELRDFLHTSGIHVIGYRLLRDLMR
jgi:predicted glycoside hydrolase/deacetylase ChbG (UPF0249 family)